MTALPAFDGETVSLVCDECGQSVTGISSSIRDWDVVWALVSKHGWTGSPLAIGPHRCPQCSGGASSPEAVEAVSVSVRGTGEPWRALSRAAGDAVVVELHGELDIAVVDDLREMLRRAREGHRDLVLDLADVWLIDSAVLGLLVRSHQAAKQRDGVVCLVAPSRFIVTVLHTLRLLGVFPIFDDCDQALRWLAATARP